MATDKEVEELINSLTMKNKNLNSHLAAVSHLLTVIVSMAELTEGEGIMIPHTLLMRAKKEHYGFVIKSSEGFITVQIKETNDGKEKV